MMHLGLDQMAYLTSAGKPGPAYRLVINSSFAHAQIAIARTDTQLAHGSERDFFSADGRDYLTANRRPAEDWKFLREIGERLNAEEFPAEWKPLTADDVKRVLG